MSYAKVTSVIKVNAPGKVGHDWAGIVLEVIPEVHLQSYRYRCRFCIDGRNWEALFSRDELIVVQE